MTKYLYIPLAIISLSGCASSSPTFTQDGREGFALNCSGTARNWGMCYSKAGAECGKKGFDILQKSDESGFGGGGDHRGYGFSSLHYRSMTIACK